MFYNKRAQGSYRFLDPKFKTFSRLFSKTIISFSIFRVIKLFICRWLITTLKNEGTKIFSWCAANKWATLSKIWPKQKRLLQIFPDFISIFHTCSRYGKFQDFFKSSKTLYEPWDLTLGSSTKLIIRNKFVVNLNLVDLYGP